MRCPVKSLIIPQTEWQTNTFSVSIHRPNRAQRHRHRISARTRRFAGVPLTRHCLTSAFANFSIDAQGGQGYADVGSGGEGRGRLPGGPQTHHQTGSCGTRGRRWRSQCIAGTNASLPAFWCSFVWRVCWLIEVEMDVLLVDSGVIIRKICICLL